MHGDPLIRILKILLSSFKALDEISFLHVGLSTWNDLPSSLRLSDSQTSFR